MQTLVLADLPIFTKNILWPNSTEVFGGPTSCGGTSANGPDHPLSHLWFSAWFFLGPPLRQTWRFSMKQMLKISLKLPSPLEFPCSACPSAFPQPSPDGTDGTDGPHFSILKAPSLEIPAPSCSQPMIQPWGSSFRTRIGFMVN